MNYFFQPVTKFIRVQHIFYSMLLVPFMLEAATIQPDRPGFSTGTSTVAPNKTNIEIGFQSSYGDHAGIENTLTAPLLNVRLGLNSTTELNVLVDGWSNVQTTNGNLTSTSDMLLGAKHQLISQNNFNVSVLGFISLPTGNATDAGNFSPFLGLLWDYEITPSISAFGTLQFVSFVEAGQRSNNFQPAIGLAFSHSEKISTYVEYYYDKSLNLNTADSSMFDAGIAYLLSDNVQLDFNFGISLDRRSSDFIGAGWAIQY